MDELSPCELMANSKTGARDIVNFIPRDNGSVERISAKRNAVIFDYHEDYEDGERILRRFISVECKDWHMKDELILLARDILSKLQLPTNTVFKEQP